ALNGHALAVDVLPVGDRAARDVDARTRLDEPARDATTYATTGPGHQRDFVTQRLHHVHLIRIRKRADRVRSYLQQLAGVAAGAFGDLGAGQHAGDLFDAAPAVEALQAHFRVAGDGLLAHQQVRVGEARDLRLVRHAQHLVGLRERLQLHADGLADAPADARVDLVK